MKKFESIFDKVLAFIIKVQLMKLNIRWTKKHKNIDPSKPNNILKFITKNSKLFKKKQLSFNVFSSVTSQELNTW